MRKGNRLLILCILLSVTQLSFPQDKLILTLEDSVRLALSQNPYHLASEERVDAAYSKLREAASGFFPSLNAQGLHTLARLYQRLSVFYVLVPSPLYRRTFNLWI